MSLNEFYNFNNKSMTKIETKKIFETEVIYTVKKDDFDSGTGNKNSRRWYFCSSSVQYHGALF